jgi:hypothetical protein
VGRSALAEKGANYKRDIGGPFTKPTHEVWKPFAPEGHVDPDVVTFAGKR